MAFLIEISQSAHTSTVGPLFAAAELCGAMPWIDQLEVAAVTATLKFEALRADVQ